MCALMNDTDPGNFSIKADETAIAGPSIDKTAITITLTAITKVAMVFIITKTI